MANRYANLVGSRKISEDFININIGFDRVQAEMDTKGTPADAQAKADAAKAAAIAAAAADLTAHKQRGADEHPTAKGNAAGFMSAADKLKLDASTNAATPDTLMQRDTAGRAKVAAPAAADDVARKAETDAVQANLDSHAADTDIHVTAADHTKLNGIEEGAQVNQNTFAKVNDVVASSKSDTLQLTGGPGITVTTDPATKRVTVTATGTATPGAHASSHVTGGSDVIPDAVIDGASGLMSGADAKFVRQDGETKVGAQAKADEVKDYIDGRLDTPERAAITLQPGVHVVNANQDAAFKLAGLQGRTVLNYQRQIGIYGVLNPYVIRYGANLLPPFFEWAGIGNIRVDAPYDMTVTAASTTQEYLRYEMQPISGQVYTISGANIRVVDFTNLVILAFTGNTVSTQTFTVPPSCKVLWIIASNVTQATIGTDSIVTSPGTYRVQNPMLNIGNVGLPFVPREDSMLALQTELHANPDTGANPDVVFERDGQYFKLAKWSKVELDSKYDYLLLNSYSGYKRIAVYSTFKPPAAISYATKYDGSLLQEEDTATRADRYNVSSGAILISIPSTDSGWGDSYLPTADEIKAYFMGWVMTTQESWSTAPVPYDGTGTKGWVRRWVNASQGNPSTAGSIGTWVDMSATPTVPTTMSAGFTPYQLLYQLVTPTVEPITSEGQLTFFDGDNQVEVGTGIVLRELASVFSNTFINAVNAGNKLKYKTTNMIAVYKDSKLDKSWSFARSSYNGEEYMYAKVDPATYTQSAAYSVSYLMLDKYPSVDFTGTYAENEKALLLDTVRTLQENTTRISVLESKKAEKDSPAWIAPTLLNNWINYGEGEDVAGYRKDENGYVHIKGLVKLGVAAAMVFKLPVGYRPKAAIRTPISGSAKFGEMTIGVDGGIYFNAGIDGTYVSMFIPPFAAEQ